MKIIKFKASIPGSKVFMREYEIPNNLTLYKLHTFLLDDLCFAPDQMVAFRGLIGSGAVLSEYGLFDMGDGTLDTVTIEKSLAKGEVVLQYVYDLRNDKVINLSYIGEQEPLSRTSYPRLVAEKGRNPEQFAKSYDDLNEYADIEGNIDSGDDDDLFLDEELPEGEE